MRLFFKFFLSGIFLVLFCDVTSAEHALSMEFQATQNTLKYNLRPNRSCNKEVLKEEESNFDTKFDEEKRENRLKCQQCIDEKKIIRSYKNQKCLEEHLRKIHNANKVITIGGQYVCILCDNRAFASQKNLNIHNSSQHKDKKISCDGCEVLFTSFASKWRHNCKKNKPHPHHIDNPALLAGHVQHVSSNTIYSFATHAVVSKEEISVILQPGVDSIESLEYEILQKYRNV